MQNKILSYILNNPKESLKVDDEIFTDESLRKIFCVLKDRTINKKATTPEFIQKEARTLYNLSDIINLQSEKISKAEYTEYLEETVYKNQLAGIDKMFGKYLERFSKAEDKDKLSVLNELKERLLKTSTSRQRYEIHGPEMFDNWLENYDKPQKYVAQFGIPGLDQTLGGLKGTELVVIVADTGIGKTNLLLNFAHQMLKQKKKILFFSLEMGVMELLDRFVPIAGKTNAHDIRQRATPKEMLTYSVTELKDFDFKIVSDGNITSDDVVAEMINQEPDVVMVDYLQRLADPKGSGNEMERLRTMTQKLKNSALNLHIPVITPAQVDKASSKSGTKRIENIAGAKDIANEADLGLYLYTEGQKIDIESQGMVSGGQKITIPEDMYLQIVKSRHSETGRKIKINFDKQNLTMTEYEQ